VGRGREGGGRTRQGTGHQVLTLNRPSRGVTERANGVALNLLAGLSASWKSDEKGVEEMR
jgi:hypothetical protein